MSTDTEVHLGQATAKNDAVGTIDNAVVVHVLVETVTNLCTCLSDMIAKIVDMVVKVGLCTGDTLIDIAIELTNLLTDEGSIVTSDIRLLAETELGNLVLQRLPAISERGRGYDKLQKTRNRCSP